MPSTLTYVGGASFIYTAVTDIQIPDSVTEIDTHAFKYCKKLKSIKLPAGIKTVPMHVLYGCTSLTSVTIPSKVTTIGEGAFRECSKLTSITIPRSVTVIEERAFQSCTSLKNVYLEPNIASFDVTAFYNCSLTVHYHIGLQTPRISYSGDITWKCVDPIYVDYVAFSKVPTKTTYYVGDDTVDVTGGKLYVLYNDDSHKIVDITSSMVTDFDFTTPGAKKVSITYEGFELSYDVNVIDEDPPVPAEKEVVGIDVCALPNKLVYVQGDELDLTGGKISILYDDATFGKLNMSAGMISGFDSSVAGKQTLTATYKGFKATFDIEVVEEEKTVTQVVISSYPKLVYYTGEALSTDGGEITVYYADETYNVLSMTDDMISGFDSSEPGMLALTVTYGGQSAQYSITVKERKTALVEVVTLNQKAVSGETIYAYVRTLDTYSLKSGSVEVFPGDDFTVTSIDCDLEDAVLSGDSGNKAVFTYLEMNDIMGNIFKITLKAERDADISTISAAVKFKNEKDAAIFDETLVMKTKNIMGDLNRDGKLTTDDAIYLLMHTYFPDDPAYAIEQDADYNRDGKVDVNDAIYLLMHINFPEDYPLDPKKYA